MFGVATALLLVAIAACLARLQPRRLAHPAIVGAGVLFLVSLIVRAWYVQPTLIHADIVAPQLVDCLLQFPQRCTTRGAPYGQYGFLAVGALTRAFGNDLNAVFHAMQVVGALNVLLLAILAYRLSGSPYGALIAVAITGTNPVFMRVGASEDMHNFGLCLGLIGLIGADAFAATRRAGPLAVAVLAFCLMVHTRQTFYIFVPCAFVLGLARGGRGLLGSWKFWSIWITVILVTLARVAGSPSMGYLFRDTLVMFAESALLPEILRHHAMFDVTRFGLLPVLTVAAMVWAGLAGGLARATLLLLLVNVGFTFAAALPSPGVEFAQRLGAFAFSVLPVAMAGAALLETRCSPSRRAVVGLAGAAVLLALPPVFPGWRTVETLTPIHREYLAVESAAAALPDDVSFLDIGTARETLQGDSRYAGLVARSGKRVHLVSPAGLATAPRPWVFLETVECWTHSFTELVGVKDPNTEYKNFTYRWDRVLFGRERSPLRPAAGPRPECRPYVRDDDRIAPPTMLAVDDDDPPFLFYSASAVPIGFHELRAVPTE